MGDDGSTSGDSSNFSTPPKPTIARGHGNLYSKEQPPQLATPLGPNRSHVVEVLPAKEEAPLSAELPSATYEFGTNYGLFDKEHWGKNLKTKKTRRPTTKTIEVSDDETL